MILAGDIGGTNTRLALVDEGPGCHIHLELRYPSQKYPGLLQIVQEFIAAQKEKISKAAFGIAGAVREGKCKATNLPWLVDSHALGRELGFPVYLLNDLEANAHGLKILRKEELYSLQKGNPSQKGNAALIAAGTGLGEAGLYWDGKRHHPFACEGGHVDFAPRNQDEFELFAFLKKRHEHVSYERVLSGSGLYALYQFLVETKREKSEKHVEEELRVQDPPKVVSRWGCDNRDPACARAVDWFLSLYGAEAGNLALKFLSLGGLYIGGGIAPHLLEKMKEGSFISSFLDKGRFRDLLVTIPIWVVLNDNAALLGAASYAKEMK